MYVFGLPDANTAHEHGLHKTVLDKLSWTHRMNPNDARMTLCVHVCVPEIGEVF